MEEIIKAFLKIAKKDRSVIRSLKHIAIESKQFELAASLRDMETKNFPESLTSNKEYKEADSFNNVLAIADLKCNSKLAFKVLSLAKIFIKKGAECSLSDVEKVIKDSIKIFGRDIK